MEFVLASQNAKKLAELGQILSEQGIALVSLPQDAPAVSEDGTTFAENALLKARSACAFTGKPAIADDSGLCVDALGGAPGIYSARYCAGTDADRTTFLLHNLTGETNRTARFVCAIACVFPSGQEITATGECAGVILEKPAGTGGFGYDPVFFLPEQGKTFAELPATIKNQISHRAKAIDMFLSRLPSAIQKEKNHAHQ